jgi:cytochrome P450
MHGLASRFRTVVDEEIAALSATAHRDGRLDWATFQDGWFRIVRRCLFGEAAAEDKDLTAMLISLRGDANWAFLHPKRKTLRARFLSRVASYLHKPEPDTLALLASRAASARARPEDQIGQWLFAFDAAGIVTFRALAILVSREILAKRARRDDRPDHPFIRACLLESIRLWPTTPAILRQTDRETDWRGAVMPEGTGLLIHVPFFHRDDERLPFAHRFAPDLWLDDGAEQMALVPFSAGPGECPAKNLVLMLGGMTIASLLRQKGYRLAVDLRMTLNALPATFDHFSIALQVQARG